MGEMIRMAMSDGAEIAVYHAVPDGERRGGLVLVQEIFGVTDHIRELCDEYAADGYEVLSPAIFDREHPGFEAAYTGPHYHRAVELARDLHPFVQSLDDAETCRTRPELRTGLRARDLRAEALRISSRRTSEA